MAFEIVDDVAAYERAQDMPYVEFQVDSVDGMPTYRDRAPVEEWDYEEEPEVSYDVDLIAKLQGGVMNILPSTFTEFAVRLPNKAKQTFENFDFTGREYLRQVYDTNSKRTLLKCGRQVEKSTLLGNKLLSYSCLIQALGALYVSPTNAQTKVFSQDRLKEPIETSEYLKTWTTTKLSDNVFLKKFVNRSQITLRYCYQSADRVRGIPADVICYDRNAQVLTRTGWVPVTELTLEHEVADVNDAGEVEWHKPTMVFSKWHSGEMVKFGHRKFSLRVTGDHKMWVNYRVKNDPKYKTPDKWQFEEASALARTDSMGFKMTAAAEWKNSHQGTLSFPPIPGWWSCRESLTLPKKEFAELVGWYIAEGHIQYRDPKNKKGPRPVITQSKYFDEVIRVVEACGLSYRVHKDPRHGTPYIHINSGHLGKYFEPLGKSRDKYIPRRFFNSPEVLPGLLRALYLGDACYHQGDEWDHGVLRTRSFRLAEDVQEAWLRLKRPAAIHTRSMVPAHQDNPDYHLIDPEPLYEVQPYKRDYIVFWRSEFDTKERVQTEIVEKEDVYCFTVKHHRPIVKGGFGEVPVISGQCIDELQDILTDNIPIIEECASHSPFKIFMYSGTPKSLDNPLEWYWQEFSTQNEWVVPCHRHTIQTPGGLSKVYWNVLGENNIGPESLVCDRCEKPISAADSMAQWASMNPNIINLIPKPYEGFRIPQIMVPWISWDEIIQKQTTYSRPKFHNEVLGLSYDTGTRPLTRQDLIDNCDPGIQLNPAFLRSMRSHIGGSTQVYGGLDWGCHDENTRILTHRGFQYFRDLTEEDEVAQWDPETREMEFVLPKVRTVKDWDQPLLHFKGKGLDMMLTHTHRMRVGTSQGKGPWVTESAGKTAGRGGNIKFVGYVDWVGEEREAFVLPGLPKSPGYGGSKDQLFRMDGWLEFMGYYLSEGGLCFNKGRPSCLKMSQRETVNPKQAEKIKRCLQTNDVPFSEFPNPKTGDLNWTIYGKQYWQWVQDNVGEHGDEKRIPRDLLGLSKRQLSILFDAMMLGDGNTDPREGNNNGYYSSTSKGLCEDFQEICIRLGLRSTLSLHKKESESGVKKAIWRTSWSGRRDFQFNTPAQRVEKVPYNGKVYCCSVPSGYIVTERNGRIAYQGNTGENSFTVLTLGCYLQDRFTIFFAKRFEGRESEPQIMIELVSQIINHWDVQIMGTDYGGGFWPNDALIRKFGWRRIAKYQYSTPNAKVKWEDGLKRFLVNRTEVMSDIFNAIKRRNVFRFPRWEDFQSPFASDCLNIFSEYSEQRRENTYKKSPSVTDDSFHSILLCFLASMLTHPRPDVIAPMRDDKAAA